MFIAGFIVIIVSIFSIIGAKSAKKRGDVRGASIGLFGRIGIVIGIILLIGSGVRIIGPGEVGVLDLFGRVQEGEIHSGVNLVNPLMRVHTFSIKTQELQESMNVPSQEGLQVDLDVSILYRVKEDAASEIFRTIGTRFEDIVIKPLFRSAARNVSVRYDAKALYTSGREVIKQSLFDDLQKSLIERGIVIEDVLLRSIKLPAMVTNAIEEKLKADQEAQKMVFVLQKEKQEAERKKVEAVGISDANKIIAQGLTSSYIQWYRIEMLKELVTSPNNTIIIIPDDLKSVPMIMNK
ncbi:MAG: prohibitin family protein [Candidatus Latescibacteria bacterium]|nr:prohibitin family protein [Candidatus Latescibacterota bacterium]